MAWNGQGLANSSWCSLTGLDLLSLIESSWQIVPGPTHSLGNMLNTRPPPPPTHSCSQCARHGLNQLALDRACEGVFCVIHSLVCWGKLEINCEFPWNFEVSFLDISSFITGILTQAIKFWDGCLNYSQFMCANSSFFLSSWWCGMCHLLWWQTMRCHCQKDFVMYNLQESTIGHSHSVRLMRLCT
jgi:hypothetical protein